MIRYTTPPASKVGDPIRVRVPAEHVSAPSGWTLVGTAPGESVWQTILTEAGARTFYWQEVKAKR